MERGTVLAGAFAAAATVALTWQVARYASLSSGSPAPATRTSGDAPERAAPPPETAPPPADRDDRARGLWRLVRLPGLAATKGRRFDWRDAREREQKLLAEWLGRRPGETDDDYRARMAPLIERALAGPRRRAKRRREEAFRAAGVTDEQRADIDAAFDRATDDALALANEAIHAGDLTPYRRNTGGALATIGSLGGVMDATQARLDEILTPEQQRAIDGTAFRWDDYFSVMTPWEQLDPPPPPP